MNATGFTLDLETGFNLVFIKIGTRLIPERKTGLNLVFNFWIEF